MLWLQLGLDGIYIILYICYIVNLRLDAEVVLFASKALKPPCLVKFTLLFFDSLCTTSQSQILSQVPAGPDKIYFDPFRLSRLIIRYQCSFGIRDTRFCVHLMSFITSVLYFDDLSEDT